MANQLHIARAKEALDTGGFWADEGLAQRADTDLVRDELNRHLEKLTPQELLSVDLLVGCIAHTRRNGRAS